MPALLDLQHQVSVVSYHSVWHVPPDADCFVLDGTQDLSVMVAACRSAELRAAPAPVILVTPLHVLAVLKVTWGFDDWVLPDCDSAELDTRLRLAAELWSGNTDQQSTTNMELDAAAYSVKVHGQPLNLTYTEFELLRALTSAPGKVWTRASLLRDVWGYEHAAGTRTVDVHIRRVRSKLGPEFAATIETVRKVGYKFVPPTPHRRSRLAEMTEMTEAFPARAYSGREAS